MTERRCENCRWWKPDGLMLHGKCKGITEDADPPRPAILARLVYGYGELRTLPEFHCALHEEKA